MAKSKIQMIITTDMKNYIIISREDSLPVFKKKPTSIEFADNIYSSTGYSAIYSENEFLGFISLKNLYKTINKGLPFPINNKITNHHNIDRNSLLKLKFLQKINVAPIICIHLKGNDELIEDYLSFKRDLMLSKLI